MNTNHLPLEAREYLALVEAATPGPWHRYDDGYYGHVCSGMTRDILPADIEADDELRGSGRGATVCGGEPNEGRMEPDSPDTILIAAAPTAILRLCEMLAEANAKLDAKEAHPPTVPESPVEDGVFRAGVDHMHNMGFSGEELAGCSNISDLAEILRENRMDVPADWEEVDRSAPTKEAHP